MKRLALLLIRAYQLLFAPLLGNVCRFEPSCSRYAMAVIDEFGVLKGSWLALRRIGRCHPWNPGGYDPPPLGHDHGAHGGAGARLLARNAAGGTK